MSQNILTKLFLIIITTSLLLSCPQQPGLSIKINRVSDRVIVFECLDVNTTAIASSKGIIIIDTHRSPGIMKEIKKRIEKEFGRNDFLYIINTHGHYDHSAGNQIFSSSTIIDHENCPMFMRQKPAHSVQAICYLKYRLSDWKARLNDLDHDSEDVNRLRADIAAWQMVVEDWVKKYIVTPPSKIFQDSLTLDSGNLKIKLIYCGNAHTDHDIFVYVPEERLVLTGDIFASKYSLGFSVNKMNNVPNVIAAMNQILRRENEIKYVVPGHGDFFSKDDLIFITRSAARKIGWI